MSSDEGSISANAALGQLVEQGSDAGAREQAEDRTGVDPAILLRAGTRWYAAGVQSVREVVAREGLTRVPSLPGHVLGLALVHGRLVPVVDLPRLMGFEDRGHAAETGPRLVVLYDGDMEVGVIGEETRGVVLIHEARTPRTPQPEFVAGEVEWEGHQVCVLDTRALIEATTAEG